MYIGLFKYKSLIRRNFFLLIKAIETHNINDLIMISVEQKNKINSILFYFISNLFRSKLESILVNIQFVLNSI
jgi:hypothetical protein